MKYKVFNKSNMDFANFKPILKSFMNFAIDKIGFEKPPALFFVSDQENARLPLGKTAHYDPASMEVVVYTDMRHPKDILRSLSHELVHHKQNCDGQFDNLGDTGEGYAQNDKHLRSMEKEAYLLGNMCLRDWEDTHKKHLQESNYYSRGDRKMNTKDWSRKELNTLLMEKFGYEKKKEPVLEEEELDEAHCGKRDEDDLDEAHCSKRDTDLDEEKMPDKNKDGIPDYAQDGKGKNDLGKAKGVDDSKDDSDEDSKKDKDLSKVPPQLRKHVAKKKKVSETQLRTAIREAIKQHFSKV